MRSRSIPFRFDLRELIGRAAKIPASIDGVAINLPFLSINLRADNIERSVARELVIRLADRRVLNSSECCDSCIDQALASLQEIRAALVDAQVNLKDHTQGPLFLVVEAMLAGLRQFLTFEQRLTRSSHEHRQHYFDALEILRAHLYRCLEQVSRIAGIAIPTVPTQMRYDQEWQLEAYEQPLLGAGSTDAGDLEV